MNNILDDTIANKKKKNIPLIIFLVVESILLFTTLLNFSVSSYDADFSEYFDLLIIPYLVSLFLILLAFAREKGKVHLLLLFLFIVVSVYVILFNGLIFVLRDFGGKISG